MDSLYKLRDMPGIDYLCVAHSHEIDKDHLIMEAKEKIDNMIETRLKKDRRTLNVLKVNCKFKFLQKFDKLSLDDLYDRMYESNNYKDN